jgi:hypothetical protein
MAMYTFCLCFNTEKSSFPVTRSFAKPKTAVTATIRDALTPEKTQGQAVMGDQRASM